MAEYRFPLPPADLMDLRETDPSRPIDVEMASVWVDAPAGMLPPKALARLLAQFTYRPGWRFVLAYSGGLHSLAAGLPSGLPGWMDWMLRVHMKVEDAYRPGVVRDQIFTILLPTYPDDAPDRYWLHWLRYEAIKLAEDHEIDEWFMVGGVRPFDPHKVKT